MIFEGVCTALVTPFDRENQIDYKSTQRLLNLQIQAKVRAILILGSTGEGGSLSCAEREEFISFARENLPKSVKLIVGVGSNQIEEASHMIDEAQRLGADACLVQTPYFMKCTQEGIFQHFKKICERTSLPIIVYNIPSRSGVNLEPDTMKRLCDFSNICGLKEANGNIDHILAMFHAIAEKTAIYCGNDNLNLVFERLGANGTISVTSNAFPKQIVEMFENNSKTNVMQDKFFDVNNLMFCEPNPIPIKYVLHKMGLIENNLRLPLTQLSKKWQAEISRELDKIGRE